MSPALERDFQIIRSFLGLIETPSIRERVERALKGEQIETEKILAAEEFGKLSRVTDRTVLKWAKQGLIRRVRFPGRKQGAGFLESDARSLLAKPIEGGGKE